MNEAVHKAIREGRVDPLELERLNREYVRWHNEAQHQSGLKAAAEQKELLARGNAEYALYQIRYMME